MWLISVYSEGDLLSDDYLRLNERVERDEDGSYFETYDCRYEWSGDLQDRLETIDQSIKRLQAEKDHLEKYGEKLVGLGSYSDLLEFF